MPNTTVETTRRGREWPDLDLDHFIFLQTLYFLRNSYFQLVSKTACTLFSNQAEFLYYAFSLHLLNSRCLNINIVNCVKPFWLVFTLVFLTELCPYILSLKIHRTHTQNLSNNQLKNVSSFQFIVYLEDLGEFQLGV